MRIRSKRRTERRREDMGTVRARSMQMREYIYLGTTPMYFLEASGRIVGGESNTHIPATPPPSILPANPRTHTHTCAVSTHTHKRRSVCVRMCHRSDTPEIYEQTSLVPRANRPASYGPIQFNFENKQPPLATSVNLFRGLASWPRCGRARPPPPPPGWAFCIVGKFLGHPLHYIASAKLSLRILISRHVKLSP